MKANALQRLPKTSALNWKHYENNLLVALRTRGSDFS